ncbi:putative transcriptional regulator [Bacillus sp. TS-2]|nr:putative transcriptional regulator [Bacillus sp. TS-2]
MSNFGERLKELRLEKGIYQKEIADLLNIHIRQVQNYEKNESDPPTSKLIKLADFFNVSLDYMAGRSDNRKRL